MALTGKKKRFFDEYIIDRNGARAAAAAGYAPGNAKQRAYKLYAMRTSPLPSRNGTNGSTRKRPPSATR